MKKHDVNSWGPDDKLGQMIGKIPYPEPRSDLVGRIMAPLDPVKPGFGHRLLGWFREPMTFTMSRALTALAMLLVLLPAGYVGYHFYGTQDQDPGGIDHAAVFPVVFYYKGQEAQSVAVMGSFNNWNPKGHELVWNSENGHWALQLNLPAGKHDYVFLVNGQKVYQDPHADLIQKDEFGNRNSVLFVKGQNGVQI